MGTDTPGNHGILRPRVTLVGELNPYGPDPRAALFPHPERSAGWHLWQLSGLSKWDYLRLERVNLCEVRWSNRAARTRAEGMIEAARPGDRSVLLGRKVTDAFGFDDPPFSRFTLALGLDTAWFVPPHPSFRCRIWNAEGSVERARALLEQALRP